MIRIYSGGERPEYSAARTAGGSSESVRSAVAGIIAAVGEHGDRAVLDFCEKFDGVRPEPLLVTKAETDAAISALPEDFLRILRRAADNIEEFHSRQQLPGFELRRPDGSVLGQRVLPLRRAGLYIPGGTAAYPSSVLMNAIPARIAGVEEIVMVTPPQRDGGVRKEILAAAAVAGVTSIYKVGGAQAVAALALGTDSIPRVDKIVGPGNMFVAEAKRQVFGLVDIDMIAGPSEILVIADESADPARLAADLLSQAEHGETSAATLICLSEDMAKAAAKEIDRQLSTLPRESIARRAIEDFGAVIVAKDLREAVDIANGIAPEHLELCVAEPKKLLPSVRNAGSVFLGQWAPEALGDYMAGPNHVLPTAGTARFSSPLSVYDFVKRMSYIEYTEDALRSLCGDIAAFARHEGLEAHARSVECRFGGEEK